MKSSFKHNNEEVNNNDNVKGLRVTNIEKIMVS